MPRAGPVAGYMWLKLGSLEGYLDLRRDGARGLLTFQCAGEDTDCTEGPLPLCWRLEAIHAWHLGRQRWGPAWFLRWRSLDAARGYTSAWGRGPAAPRAAAGPGAASLGSGLGGGHRETGGDLEGTLGFPAPNSLPVNSSSTPPAHQGHLHSPLFFTISHQWQFWSGDRKLHIPSSTNQMLSHALGHAKMICGLH